MGRVAPPAPAFRLGACVRRGSSLWVRHLGVFLLITLLAHAPLIAWLALLYAGMSARESSPAWRLAAVLLPSLGSLWILTHTWAAGAVARAVDDLAAGNRVRGRRCFRGALRAGVVPVAFVVVVSLLAPLVIAESPVYGVLGIVALPFLSPQATSAMPIPPDIRATAAARARRGFTGVRSALAGWSPPAPAQRPSSRSIPTVSVRPSATGASTPSPMGPRLRDVQGALYTAAAPLSVPTPS